MPQDQTILNKHREQTTPITPKINQGKTTPYTPLLSPYFLALCLSVMTSLAISAIPAIELITLAVSIGIINKMGAASIKEWSLAKFVEGYRLRARATGKLSNTQLSLDANAKNAMDLLNSSESAAGDTTTGDNTQGGGTTGGGGTSQGGSTDGTGDNGDGLE